MRCQRPIWQPSVRVKVDHTCFPSTTPTTARLLRPAVDLGADDVLRERREQLHAAGCEPRTCARRAGERPACRIAAQRPGHARGGVAESSQYVIRSDVSAEVAPDAAATAISNVEARTTVSARTRSRVLLRRASSERRLQPRLVSARAAPDRSYRPDRARVRGRRRRDRPGREGRRASLLRPGAMGTRGLGRASGPGDLPRGR